MCVQWSLRAAWRWGTVPRTEGRNALKRFQAVHASREHSSAAKARQECHGVARERLGRGEGHLGFLASAVRFLVRIRIALGSFSTLSHRFVSRCLEGTRYE